MQNNKNKSDNRNKTTTSTEELYQLFISWIRSIGGWTANQKEYVPFLVQLRTCILSISSPQGNFSPVHTISNTFSLPGTTHRNGRMITTVKNLELASDIS